MRWIKPILRFLILLMLQVLLLDNLQFLGICHPYIYLISLIALPIGIPVNLAMIIGFIVGLIVDMFANTIGVHAAVCILLMYIRPYLLKLCAVNTERMHGEIHIATIGTLAYVKYAIGMVFIHHLVLFFLNAWGFQHIWFTLIEIGVSTVLSIACVLMYDFLQNR